MNRLFPIAMTSFGADDTIVCTPCKDLLFGNGKELAKASMAARKLAWAGIFAMPANLRWNIWPRTAVHSVNSGGAF